MHRDVTEVHELENQVRNQKLLIESVVDMAPVLMALLNTRGEVVLGNQAYQRLSTDLQERDPAQVILLALSEVMSVDLLEPTDRGRNFLNMEIQIELPESVSTRWFSCSGIWVDESDIAVDNYFEREKEQCLLLVANDVTQQKQQQEQVRTNAIRALMAEQQLAYGMRETLSGAIFQLQGPFNMLSAALAILKRRGEDQSDPLQTALEEVLNIGETVVSNLNAALPRQTKEAVQPVNLNEVVREVLSIATDRLLAQGVQVDLKLDADLPPVLGHRYELCSLVKQLVDNAIDALSESGITRRELLVATRVSDDGVEVSIRDTGPGIMEANRFKAFEPFFSAWKQGKSKAGMGLTIALEVARYHGGSIEIMPENQYRHGCLVRLYLPLQAPRHLTDEISE
jgi:nitrogen fixation negative regulator NifL